MNGIECMNACLCLRAQPEGIKNPVNNISPLKINQLYLSLHRVR